MSAVEQQATAPAPLAPPHNLEAEQSVLGAILLADTTLYGLVINEGLKPEHFYREQHAPIYAAMLRALRGEPRDRRAHGHRAAARRRASSSRSAAPAMVDALAGAAPAAGNVREYARIVQSNALLRRLLTTTQQIQASVWNHEAPPRELVEWAERDILEVAHDDRQKDFRADRRGAARRDRQAPPPLARAAPPLTGTPSGFKDLDEITGGFQPGNLIILAARPSMGKSALVTNIAENAALEHGKPVALFSLEMSEAELAQRFVASQARIQRRGAAQGPRRGEPLAEDPRGLPAPVATRRCTSTTRPTSGSSSCARRRGACTSRAPDGLGLIIVDYLQLMRADGRVESRVEAVGQMSRGLKILARELEVPVIALSQLSRARRVAHRQEADPLRPARVRPDRAGRRPRHVHLPRRVLRQESPSARARRTSSSPSTATARSATSC